MVLVSLILFIIGVVAPTSSGFLLSAASSRSSIPESLQAARVPRVPTSRGRPIENPVDQVTPPLHSLLSWLSKIPGAQLDRVELRGSLLGDGVGAYSTEEIGDGEVVFAVPSKSFISVSDALTHPLLGPEMRKLWDATAAEDSKGSVLLAGLLAHLQLNIGENSDFLVYLDMLPKHTPREKHVLWWSEAEMGLLEGLSSKAGLEELRRDVESSIATLCSGVLAADVVKHGEANVCSAVRAGFVSVLSRTYAVASSDGRDFRTLIPLLDALNHRAPPNVRYSFEGQACEAGLSGLLVARAIGQFNQGEELAITYGDHPAFIFCGYYGFVPALLEQPASCFASLNLGAFLETFATSDSEAASAVLAAQLEAERDESEVHNWDLSSEEWDAVCLDRPTAALAAFFAGRSPHTSFAEVGEQFHPLVFGVSAADLEMRRAHKEGLEGLRLCARLCPVGMVTAQSKEGTEKLNAAIGQLLRSSEISVGSDVAAARLVTAAARFQMGVLQRAAPLREAAAACSRPSCVSLAHGLMISEVVLLEALCTEGAGGLFSFGK